MRSLQKSNSLIFICFIIITALIAVSLWRPSYLLLQPHTPPYKLTAYFTNIGNLKVHAKVSIAGVSVGKVNSISLDDQTHLAKVIMTIDKGIDFISVDSVASIVASNLMGKHHVNLVLGSSNNYMQDGDTIYNTQSAITVDSLLGNAFLQAILVP